MVGCLGELEGFLNGLRGRGGYRGLVVLHCAEPREAVEAVAGVLAGRGGCVGVVTRGLRPRGGWPRGCLVRGPGGLGELLGREAHYALAASEGLLRPNVVAGLAGVVEAGGALVVVAPRLASWNPGPAGGRGGYRRYLLASLREARSILWAEGRGDGGCRVLLRRLPGPAPRGWRRRGGARLGGGLARLGGLLTPGQAEALRRYLGERRRLRGFLALGGRGRGKSFLLGVVAAVEAWLGLSGPVALVAPSPGQLGSLLRGLRLAAARLGLRVERRSGELVVGDAVFRYAAPGEVAPAPVVVVDEAAAVGAARLRRYSRRAWRLLAATTTHGYEGAGRLLALEAEEVMPRPLLRVVLEDPVRYPPGDPLEDWVEETFVLRPRGPGAAPVGEPGSAVFRVFDPVSGAGDTGLVRGLASLLMEAHYRAEPDYLLVLLESTTHEVVYAETGGHPVAVADVGYEEPGLPEPGRLSLRLLGELLGGEPGLCAARVVRIAVHPGLQRRGLGSRLLRFVEERAAGRGCGLVTAVYGRPGVTPFWLRNGYTVFYVSPRYNKVTGEKNFAVAKPLAPRAGDVLAEAVREAAARLVLAAHVVYRDVAAERLAEALASMARYADGALRAPPGRAQLERALHVLESRGAERLESVTHVVYAAAAHLLPGAVRELTREELVAVTAYVLQGKPLNEVADAIGKPVGEAAEVLLNASVKLLRLALEHRGKNPGEPGGLA